MFIKFFQLLHWIFLDGRKKAAMRMLEYRVERENRHRTEERNKK